MEPLSQSTDIIQQSFSSFWNTLMGIMPSIIGAILLIVIGWGVAKLVSFAIRKLLQSLRFDTLGEKLLDHTSLKIDRDRVKPSEWVGAFAYWIILLMFFISASDTMGWTVVSASISNLVNYLPQLFSALLIFAIGLYIGSFVRGFIRAAFDSLGLSAGNILSEITFYIILIIVGTTALEQAGIDTSIITANISIILGGMLLAFAIGFGYSSRDVLTNTLASFYARNTFSVGQTIKIDDIEGVISQIDNIQTVLITKNGELIIPTKRLITDTIERLHRKKPSKPRVPAAPK